MTRQDSLRPWLSSAPEAPQGADPFHSPPPGPGARPEVVAEAIRNALGRTNPARPEPQPTWEAVPPLTTLSGSTPPAVPPPATTGLPSAHDETAVVTSADWTGLAGLIQGAPGSSADAPPSGDGAFPVGQTVPPIDRPASPPFSISQAMASSPPPSPLTGNALAVETSTAVLAPRLWGLLPTEPAGPLSTQLAPPWNAPVPGQEGVGVDGLSRSAAATAATGQVPAGLPVGDLFRVGLPGPGSMIGGGFFSAGPTGDLGLSTDPSPFPGDLGRDTAATVPFGPVFSETGAPDLGGGIAPGAWGGGGIDLSTGRGSPTASDQAGGPALDLSRTNELLQQLLDEVRRGGQSFLPPGNRNHHVSGL